MKCRVTIFITTLLLLLITIGCSSPRTRSLTTSNELNNIQTNVLDDISPKPEEILRAAGIKLTIPTLSALVRDVNANNELRYWAAIALGRTGDQTTLPVLAEALGSSNVDLRYGAVLGIGELKSAAGVPYLKTALRDLDVGVRSIAVSTLGKIGSIEAAKALAEKVGDRSETDATVRMNAAFQLARLTAGTGEVKSAEVSVVAISPLRELLTDGSAPVRGAAAIALATLGDQTAVPALVEAALDPLTEEWLRVDAIQALEQISGQKFNYIKPYNEPTTEQERAAALQYIHQWWQANEHNYPQSQSGQ